MSAFIVCSFGIVIWEILTQQKPYAGKVFSFEMHYIFISNWFLGFNLARSQQKNNNISLS